MSAVELYFTPEEVAGRFKINPETVRRRLRTGAWPGVKIAGVWRITRHQLQQIEEGAVTGRTTDRGRIHSLVTRLAS